MTAIFSYKQKVGELKEYVKKNTGLVVHINTEAYPVAISFFKKGTEQLNLFDRHVEDEDKGKTPVSKNIRGLAWVAVRWAATVRPRVIILENVEEFMTWGPIKDGQPIKEKAGQTFRSFVNTLKKHGYAVDWRVMRACDYGAPTSRKRFFLIARCDGQPIVFPEPTHGDKKAFEAVQNGGGVH